MFDPKYTAMPANACDNCSECDACSICVVLGEGVDVAGVSIISSVSST